MPKGVMVYQLTIIGLIFTIALLNVICPKLMWKTFESWKATKEPSNAYFISRRIIGVIIIAVLLAMSLLPYIMG
ncbi:hypothetical protein Cpap_0979 [Ruminiclostridium papyrosolvens DSM 2782]|uniref:DUF6199 domain-containing protein n=1 Tax=Ruminiclostridium papyrosolvens DSM 2782 TaxID=588581 RepID=F1TFX9_9FIRM|nr:DUF6199 family natural product biosynthesis protein [Ruminiclostridium papyrosolvens]EGD46598.1 hypothetical protein Cpap_0979 [Ruminiclostridium papyrosolvens DSM 2782]WES35747.1 hypothetical protein P0092_07210 [Ruminiclostridium papyrosolvens DSM 2782]